MSNSVSFTAANIYPVFNGGEDFCHPEYGIKIFQRPRVNSEVKPAYGMNSVEGNRIPPWFSVDFCSIDADMMAESIVNCEFDSLSPFSVKLMLNECKSEIDASRLANFYSKIIKHPKCSGTVAYISLLSLLSCKKSHEADEHEKVLVLCFSLNGAPSRYDFHISEQEFKIANFEGDPLATEEIHALPYLCGAYPGIFRSSDSVFERFRESVSRKILSAGFPVCAAKILNKCNN